jgi:Acyclic terpene utilisation family protein AtuA
MQSVRIGAGQGFYGDTPTGALAVAERGDVRYICCDALAELTMAILARDRVRDPDRGYARDLPEFMRTLLPPCRHNRVRIVTNAGGINPAGGAKAVAAVARELGMHDLRIATVSGDDLTTRLDELSQNNLMQNLDTSQDIGLFRDRIVFAVAYLGVAPILEALRQSADVVITGRVADASLFLAPMIAELGWQLDDWDRLASGVVLGHLMECSGQATGGNFGGAWQSITGLDNVGYPVCEMFSDGSAMLSKSPQTGGRVDVETVKEQLLYEVQDPSAYLNPDVVANFTTANLEQAGTDHVRITGVSGSARPEQLKVIGAYMDGWLGVATIAYSWPNALEKARASAELIMKMAGDAGVQPLSTHTELIGVDSAHGKAAPIPGDINEVTLRIAGRFSNSHEAEAFSRIATPLALNGPPFISGGAAPGKPRPLLGIWPTLVRREDVSPTVSVVRADELI